MSFETGNRFKSALLVAPILLLFFLPVARANAGSTGATGSSSDPLGPALDHFYNLEYDLAERQLNARLKEYPEDLRALCYLARVFMEREMYRRQMLEAQVYGKGGEAFRGDKSDTATQVRQKVFGLLDQLDRLAQDRLHKDRGDKEALYWLGESHVARAIFLLSLERSKMQALSQAKQAHKYHIRLLKLDPDFVDAYMVVGTYDYIVGSLPWYTKVVAALIGYRGNRQRGLAELQRAAEHGRWSRTDAQTFLSILYYREKDYAKAIRILKDLEQKYPRNSLLPQEIARAYKAQGNWRAAADEYDSIADKWQNQSPGFANMSIAKTYYQAGEVYMHLGEQAEALKRYDMAAELHDGSIYGYRAELAAAAIELKQHRTKDARARYERVAKDVPDSDEGRTAIQALRDFATTSNPGTPMKDAH